MKRVNIYSGLLMSIIIYGFTALSNQLVSNIPISKLSGVIVAVFIAFIYIRNMTSYSEVIILFFCLFESFVTILLAEDQIQNLNDLLWFTTTILAIVLASNENVRNKIFCSILIHHKFIKVFVYLYEIVIVSSIFIPSSYSINSGWGSTNAIYFHGFSINSHTFASSCCLMIIVLFCYFSKKKFKFYDFLYFIPPIYGILYSGARTFLVSIAILIIIFVYLKIRTKSLRLFIFIAFTIVFIYALSKSSMMNKIDFTLNNKYAINFIDSLTNGRSIFWLYDLIAYGNLNIINKLIGKGFDYVYSVSRISVGLSIWAHNDIINNLLSVGIFGSLFYLYCWWRYIFSLFFRTHKQAFKKTFFLIYVFFPMLLNGLYAYQQYVFSIILLSVLLFNNRLK